MIKLVFATNNKHKLNEIQSMLGDRFQLLSLSDIGCEDDIPETCNTLEGNASQKARYIFDKYGLDCFADDTGLEVDALGMAPGVYSARYAGPQRNSVDNMSKLLLELDKINNRNARFRTVISFIMNGTETLFEGIVEGQILRSPRGEQGFGYDPVFQPDGFELSFAEMDMSAKNEISHRGRAFAKLINFLTNMKDS
ncbi:MAG TPA: non-canonical purine NTP diphosphatase [Prolixibacteraceae bacterium]|nr:non-canonical purine NTP diphosphatase [Prolixibacteraceae bacterium]